MSKRRTSLINKENQDPINVGSNKKVKESAEATTPKAISSARAQLAENKQQNEEHDHEQAKAEPSQELVNLASEPSPSAEEIEAKIKLINCCLKTVESPGSYAFDGEATELPTMMGLEVKGFGLVHLPLTDLQAKKLIGVCKQAPYGKNQQTLIDKNVRDSYQLSPSSIKIGNKTWNAKLKELVARVSKGLGCVPKVEAKLYKMLIYKTGGHFLKHRDTEKEKNMFATLVLQLPSIYTGGNLVVYHGTDGSKKCIDFGQKQGKSQFSIYFAAHYADLEHELLEITSGYRVALVYSLCWKNGLS
jgi:hypothetical protein